MNITDQKRKRIFLIALTLVAIWIVTSGKFNAAINTWITVHTLDDPNIFTNYDIGTGQIGLSQYNLQTKETNVLFPERCEVIWASGDGEKILFFQYHNFQVIRGDGITSLTNDGFSIWELNLEAGEPEKILDSALMPPETTSPNIKTLRYVPESSNISFLDDQGTIFVYDRTSEQFQSVAKIESDYFEWYDAQTIVVQDEEGLAKIDVRTGARVHWVSLALPKDNYLFQDASNLRFFSIYKEDMVLFFNEDRQLYQAHISENSISINQLYSGRGHVDSYAVSPDGKAILIGVKEWKSTLFNPRYYAVYLYANGTCTRIKSFDYAQHFDLSLAW